MSRLGEEEIRRYSRQILLREVGGRGQSRILETGAVLLCRGRIAESLVLYLSRAGVQRITVRAFDEEAAERLRALCDAEGSRLRDAVHIGPLEDASDDPCPELTQAMAASTEILAVGWWRGAAQGDGYFARLLGVNLCVGRGMGELPAGTPARAGAPVSIDEPTALLAGSALALCMLQGLLGLAVPAVTLVE